MSSFGGWTAEAAVHWTTTSKAHTPKEGIITNSHFGPPPNKKNNARLAAGHCVCCLAEVEQNQWWCAACSSLVNFSIWHLHVTSSDLKYGAFVEVSLCSQDLSIYGKFDSSSGCVLVVVPERWPNGLVYEPDNDSVYARVKIFVSPGEIAVFVYS